MSQEPGQPQPASQPFGVPSPGQYGQQPPPGDYGQYGQPAPPPGDYGQYGQPAPPPGDYGQYGQPLPPQGQYGQYGQSPGQGGYYGPGFVPAAAQPGIIPLRPLTLGEIYDGAFRAIRSNPLVMFGLAIIVVGLGAIVQLGFTAAAMGRIERAAQAGTLELEALFSVGSMAGVLLSSAAVSLATLVLEGLAILSVSESVLGRKISLGQVWQRARGRLWRLVALSLLLGLAGVVAVVGAGALVILLAVALAEISGDGVLALVILVPLLFLLLAGVVAFFAVRLMLATCVIMLEGTGVFASIARSWRLTRGNFWRLFGIMLLTVVLVTILVSILSVPFSMFGSVFAVQGDVMLPLILSSIGSLVGSAVSIPVMAAVLALLYIDVRMRKEGLDVELARAAQGG
ncbi:Membrane domain of glycerophosphoryl diester phosphodiesterase [Georgenia satyanarayanai]|uniref:Membrane domain of glycerophosphoryl diester phosphodiesterase n=1 Tax=Georgenia satyanarayanai TaxID=860221 RepID=A0A2Y9AG48_9MICO|nr:glycerophosphoryl diester phosphodiesterase membrane domain-containing protein [Georgenia satyanarayanai]PYF99363.1 glycerophosphoryl diester phosphodiesterase family protein [Georgenia satyanarayanai]SSA43175.1 Membrane domain of glycerophosphoryl diester phosphodiesterase [Georgenia satyanarayanai]